MNDALSNRWRTRTPHLIAAGLLACAGCSSMWDSWLVERCTAKISADMREPIDATAPVATTNRPLLVRIPAGTLLMGSPTDEPGRFEAEEAQHGVKITRDFWMSESEITQGQYLDLMGVNPSAFKTSGTASVLPVETVSWIDAIKYCNQLSTKEGLEPCYQVVSDNDVRWERGPACTGYRLPTESEWEYAARANGGTLYSGSANIGDVAWYNDAAGGTHAVKGKQANAWQLYDMTGNVWEWVWDFYQAAYPTTLLENPSVDPTGPSGTVHVYRGGSWSVIETDVRIMRVANRRREAPTFKDDSLGFRIVKTSVPSAPSDPGDPDCP